jgi:hypothetical protein
MIRGVSEVRFIVVSFTEEDDDDGDPLTGVDRPASYSGNQRVIKWSRTLTRLASSPAASCETTVRGGSRLSAAMRRATVSRALRCSGPRRPPASTSNV